MERSPIRCGILGLCLLLAPPLRGQAGSADLSKDAAKASPLTGEEQNEVLEPLTRALKQMVNLRKDGSASAAHHLDGVVTHIEWRNFRIEGLRRSPLMEADRSNGITRRYKAVLRADSYRRWDRKQNRWTEWESGGYPYFPLIATIEAKGGPFSTTMDGQGGFVPGPGEAAPETAPGRRETGAPELPPGMSRAK